MDAQTSKKAKIVGIILAIVVFALLMVWMLKPSSSSAAPSKKTTPTPEPKPEDPVVTPPIEKLGPDPMSPTTTPTKGAYYIVQNGDSDSRICQKAGFAAGQVYRARCVMRDHELNAWIPQTGSGAVKALNLFQGWAPMTGKESLSWAWKTPRITWGGKRWPIVYVPKDSEVQV